MSLLVLAAGCCGMLNRLPRTTVKPPAKSPATRVHRRLLHTAVPATTSRQTAMKSISEDTCDPRKIMPERSYADDLREQPNVEYTIRPIGFVKSPYKERFGTPRQATVETQILGGAPQEGELVLEASIAKESLRGLDGFDYCWVMSWMHLNTGYKPLITPPRLRPGKNKVKLVHFRIAQPTAWLADFGRVLPLHLLRHAQKTNPRVGLFATRAPHRPNQIALSALRIVSVCEKSGVVRVRGIDLIDGTPIIDIKARLAAPSLTKTPTWLEGWLLLAFEAFPIGREELEMYSQPYVPYCDAFPDAASGWVGNLPQPNGPDYVRYSPPPKHLGCQDSLPEEDIGSQDSSPEQ